MAAKKNQPGATSNIRISPEDLRSPDGTLSTTRLMRKLELMELRTEQVATVGVQAHQAAQQALAVATGPGLPVLTGISPSTGERSSTVSVTLTGGNFGPTAMVATDNAGITVGAVTYVDATKLTVDFTIAALAALGPCSVTVSLGLNTTGAVLFLVTTAGGGSGALGLTLSSNYGEIGKPFQAALQAYGGAGGYTYSINDPTDAPPCSDTGSGYLEVGASSGALVGTPSAVGTYDFTGKVTDSALATATYACHVTIVQSGSTALTLVFGVWQAWEGIYYSSKVLTAMGGSAPYTYSIAGTLPPSSDGAGHMVLNASTGVLSGTPNAPGSYPYTATVEDALGVTVTAVGVIVVQPHVSIAVSGLVGQQDVPFQCTITISGGQPSYTVTTVNLPAWLTLNSTSSPWIYTLTGTPTSAWVYTGVLINVEDVNHLTASTGSLTFSVNTSSGSSVLLTITGTPVGRDTGFAMDSIDNSQSEIMQIGAAVSFTGGGAPGASIPAQICTAWVSKDGGNYFTWLGADTWIMQGQEQYFPTPRPGLDASWSLYIATGAIPGNVATLILRASLGVIAPNGTFSNSFTATGMKALSVTGAEVASGVYQGGTDGGLRMAVTVSAVLSGGKLPQRERLWFNYGDGNGWTLYGDVFADSLTPSWTLGLPTQGTGITIPGDLWVPTDPAITTWSVAIEANSFDQQPSAAAVWNSFTVTPAQRCPATDCTSIQFVPNPVGGLLIDYYGPDASGSYHWIWHQIEYEQPSTAVLAGVNSDPYFLSSFATVQKGWAVIGTGTVTGGTNVAVTGFVLLSTDVGCEIHVGGVLSSIQSVNLGANSLVLVTPVTSGIGEYVEIWRPAADREGYDDPDAQEIGYRGQKFSDGPKPSDLGATLVQFIGVNGWDIPPLETIAGLTNHYRQYRHRVYAISRLADNESGNDYTITLQTGWPVNLDGSTDHGDLTPTPQTAAGDARLLNSRTLGSGITGGSGVVPAINYGAALGDDGTGKAAVKIAGPLYADISNNLNIRIASDFVVTLVGGQLTLGQGIVDLAKATNFDTSQFSGGGGSSLAIKALAVNKLIAGDALFAGQATFAYQDPTTHAIKGKVTIDSGGITLADAYPTANTTMTMTSAGTTIAKGTSSVQIIATGVAIYGPSGSLTATSGGIVITNTGVSLSISANQIQMVGPSGTLTASVAGIVISNSTNNVAVTPSAVTIAVGGVTQVTVGTTILGAGLQVGSGSNTTIIVGGQIQCMQISAGDTVAGVNFFFASPYTGVATAGSIVPPTLVKGFIQVQVTDGLGHIFYGKVPFYL